MIRDLFLKNGSSYTDPYYQNVSLLLNGDGTDGYTVFTNNSLTINSFTAYGNARIVTGTKKYGTGSMYFDGTGDYIQSISATNILDFGSSDFTVEMWINFAVVNSDQTLITVSASGTSNTNIRIQGSSTTPALSIGSLGYTWENTGPAQTWNVGTWYHIAITRQGTTLRMFRDGVGIYSGTNNKSYTSTGGVDIANNTGGAGYFNGYIDDLRITKGIARYTANFTSPTAALTL